MEREISEAYTSDDERVDQLLLRGLVLVGPVDRCRRCSATEAKAVASEAAVDSIGAPRPLMRCGKCRVVRYCCADCQRTDWTAHRKWCIAVVRSGIDVTKAKAAVQAATKSSTSTRSSDGLPAGVSSTPTPLAGSTAGSSESASSSVPVEQCLAGNATVPCAVPGKLGTDAGESSSALSATPLGGDVTAVPVAAVPPAAAVATGPVESSLQQSGELPSVPSSVPKPQALPARTAPEWMHPFLRPAFDMVSCLTDVTHGVLCSYHCDAIREDCCPW
jgi:hypothetical protein